MQNYYIQFTSERLGDLPLHDRYCVLEAPDTGVIRDALHVLGYPHAEIRTELGPGERHPITWGDLLSVRPRSDYPTHARNVLFALLRVQAPGFLPVPNQPRMIMSSDHPAASGLHWLVEQIDPTLARNLYRLAVIVPTPDSDFMKLSMEGLTENQLLLEFTDRGRRLHAAARLLLPDPTRP